MAKSKSVVASISERSIKRAKQPLDQSEGLVIAGDIEVAYTHSRTDGVEHYVIRISSATPMQLVQTEKNGVDGRFLKDLAKHLDIPVTRLYDMIGVPKATAEKKASAGELIAGSGGQAAIAIAKLLGLAKSIVENSTAPEAAHFDSAKWLGRWLEQPQPALGGRKPSDLIDTPTGVEVVSRLLGSLESGAYQ